MVGNALRVNGLPLDVLLAEGYGSGSRVLGGAAWTWR